ncbi:MAG: hypothetical protein M0T74_06220 [Desulfitobacterium hafniense]|nr:hypothetical protein [Desulfitobacterium hafniense]
MPNPCLKDIILIVTSFSVRIYGESRRKVAKKIETIVMELGEVLSESIRIQYLKGSERPGFRNQGEFL